MSNKRHAKVIVDLSVPSRDGISYPAPGPTVSYPVQLRSGLTVYMENAMMPLPFFSLDAAKCCCSGMTHSPDCAQYVAPRPAPREARRQRRR